MSPQVTQGVLQSIQIITMAIFVHKSATDEAQLCREEVGRLQAGGQRRHVSIMYLIQLLRDVSL